MENTCAIIGKNGRKLWAAYEDGKRGGKIKWYAERPDGAERPGAWALWSRTQMGVGGTGGTGNRI